MALNGNYVQQLAENEQTIFMRKSYKDQFRLYTFIRIYHRIISIQSSLWCGYWCSCCCCYVSTIHDLVLKKAIKCSTCMLFPNLYMWITFSTLHKTCASRFSTEISSKRPNKYQRFINENDERRRRRRNNSWVSQWAFFSRHSH